MTDWWGFFFQNNDRLEFPAFTVCNFNRLKLPSLEASECHFNLSFLHIPKMPYMRMLIGGPLQ